MALSYDCSVIARQTERERSWHKQVSFVLMSVCLLVRISFICKCAASIHDCFGVGWRERGKGGREGGGGGGEREREREREREERVREHTLYLISILSRQSKVS